MELLLNFLYLIIELKSEKMYLHMKLIDAKLRFHLERCCRERNVNNVTYCN